MQDIEFFKQILKLNDDWYISEIELDEPSHRLDITIYFGKPGKKSFFKRSSAADTAKQHTRAYRHLPLGGYRTYLHVPIPGTVKSDKTWGNAISLFTHEMEAYIVQVLNSCGSIASAANLAGITPAEAREISERTGAGPEQEERETCVSAPAEQPALVMETERDSIRSINPKATAPVPVETHPNWQRFINGEIPIQASAIALQMLLQRVRQQIAKNPSEETRLSSARLLRQYFIKNLHLHQAELNILGGDMLMSGLVAADRGLTGIPSETEHCWQQIIDGDLRIATGEVGLQMILERVRLSIEQNPSEASRRAGVKILRQFFIKHQGRLQPELRQIGRSPGPVVSGFTGSADNHKPLGVPPESHPCWQRLISGDLEIRTDVVALKMMLESIRISIGSNPSDASLLAGIKILRQYFLKHQNKHRAEINQLLAA